MLLHDHTSLQRTALSRKKHKVQSPENTQSACHCVNLLSPRRVGMAGETPGRGQTSLLASLLLASVSQPRGGSNKKNRQPHQKKGTALKVTHKELC